MIENKEKIPLCVWKANLLQKAIDKYGVGPQIDMLIEESAELIVALEHLRRERIGWDTVAEEIIDTEIMLDQVKLIINDNTLLKKIENDKLNRLECRLKNV